MGVPFLLNFRGIGDLVPIGAWALLNAIVLTVALAWRRHAGTTRRSAPAGVARLAAARLGTWMFGGVTATFLAFYGDLVPQFPTFLLRLLGAR
jgi:hypothetical protein